MKEDIRIAPSVIETAIDQDGNDIVVVTRYQPVVTRYSKSEIQSQIDATQEKLTELQTLLASISK